MNNNTFSPGSFVCPPGFTMTVQDDSFPELDDDEELCLIRAPWDFDMTLLHGQKIHLLESVVVQDSNERKFELMPLDNTLTQNISALILTNEESQIVQVPHSFKRHFSITEKFAIPDFEAPCTSEGQENNIVVPQGLSQRFFPFGSGYPVVSHKGSKKSKTRDVSENRKPKHKRHHTLGKKNLSVETDESMCFVDDKHTVRKKPETQACEFVLENNKKHRHKKSKMPMKKDSSSATDDSSHSTYKHTVREQLEIQACEFVLENNKKHRHKKSKTPMKKDSSSATDDSSHSTYNKHTVREQLETQACEFVLENNKKHSHRKSKKNLCGITDRSPCSVDEKHIKKKIKVEVEI